MADPVADFLAREQDALADIGDDSTPTSGADSIADVPQQPGPGAEFADFNALATGGDSGVDLSALDPASVNIVNGNSASPPNVGLNVSNSPSMPVSNGGSTASLQGLYNVPRIEAESITRWRAEQAEMLEKKDLAEQEKMVEMREAAKKELEQWHKNREETLKKAKAANREHQEQLLNGQVNGESQEGTNWTEVNRLCEFSSKAAKTNTKDVSRLKNSYQKMADENGQK